MNAPAKIEVSTEPDLVLIPPQYIAKVVPLIEPWVKAVVDRSGGDLSFEGILGQWMSGAWQLWVINTDKAIKAVLATDVHVQISGRKACCVHFLTGEDSGDWLHLEDKLAAWAKHQGAVKINGDFRRGWAKRLPHWRMTHVFLERDLT